MTQYLTIENGVPKLDSKNILPFVSTTKEINFTVPRNADYFLLAVPGAVANNRVLVNSSLTTPIGVDSDELEMEPLICYGECLVNGNIRVLVVAANPTALVFGKRNIDIFVG